MAKKLVKDISGSVQEKRGMLYLVVSYKDPITQKNKTKWVGMGVPVGFSQIYYQQSRARGEKQIRGAVQALSRRLRRPDTISSSGVP